MWTATRVPVGVVIVGGVDRLLRALSGRGAAGRRELVADGVTRVQLDRALAQGRVHRVSRDVYALDPACPAALAAAAHGVLSHASAAQHWMLEQVGAPGSVHVTVPRGARRQVRRGVTLHWVDLPSRDLVGGVTGVERTVLDCARSMGFPDALAVADSALRRDACDPSSLVARSLDLRGAGSGAVRRVAAAADGRSVNPFESVLRAVVLGAGLHGFEPQLQVGRARVDLADPRRRVALEADSFAFHGSRAALDRDCRRYDDLVAMGWTVLRFSWEQVMFDRPWVAERVHDVVRLAHAGGRRLRRPADVAIDTARTRPGGLRQVRGAARTGSEVGGAVDRLGP